MVQPEIQEIIEPIHPNILTDELTRDKFVRKTNYGNNEIYIITHQNSPNVMKEIGRLRELSFRLAGGGTGKSMDIDDFDVDENPYSQLIVWEPNEKEIIGGYRFFNCNNLKVEDKNSIKLATAELFNFSDTFINEYLKYSIELGRSFVRPEYQARNAGRKAVFALDNLWDGLGALTIDNPSIKYYIGKITMYLQFDPIARDMILHFFSIYFKDNEKLIYAKEELGFTTDKGILDSTFCGNDYDKDYRLLSKIVRERNESIPPLFNSYMNLSPTMKVFGTATNHHFGGVEETGIMITINDIYQSKKHRHLSTYHPVKKVNPNG
ncbi:MAG: GNAT family N-acetyltransferase [Bacteroidales bacterium]